jgi:DNA replication protein DnaC
MSITIKKNDKPNLKKCEMLCDKEIHPKLNKFELTKLGLNQHSTNLLIGKPGSGKTSLMYSFLQNPKLLKKCYHNIILFQPRHSRASMKDNIFDNIPEENKYDEMTYENLQDALDYCKNEDEEYNTAIIFDDMGAYLRNADTLNLFKELVMNRRHYHVTIFFLVQTYLSVHPEIRKLFSNIFLFRSQKKETELLFKELVEGKHKYLNDIVKIIFNEPYKWMFLNVDSQRIFDGFDELIFNDENE